MSKELDDTFVNRPGKLAQRSSEFARELAIKDEIVNDFEEAMNLIIAYQRCLKILSSPDPNFPKARRLLTKYRMAAEEPTNTYRIYADGVDITIHPDSIEATVADEAAELDYGTETMELVRDNEMGKMYLIEGEKILTLEADTFADNEDPEGPVDPATRDWLSEGGQ